MEIIKDKLIKVIVINRLCTVDSMNDEKQKENESVLYRVISFRSKIYLSDEMDETLACEEIRNVYIISICECALNFGL